MSCLSLPIDAPLYGVVATDVHLYILLILDVCYAQ
jgi:hypothetical protein